MDLSNYEVEIKRHALIRASQQDIHPDLIEDVLHKGKVEHYGKHGIKIVCKGRKRTIICVGQIIGTKIKIFTIEEGN